MSASDTVAVLPDDLANQIAAGEVVERPASVVKELVENAVDAGATRIDVSIEGGGVGLVSVVDDGIGMSARDAQTAMLRHATSKIARSDDLFSIKSFGFRGEALPSIASVSRFRLETRRREDLEATVVVQEGGGALSVSPSGSPIGTRVEARDLFFNVPVRRKFLRALPTESAHVSEVVDSVALGHPEIAVRLSRDGRQVKAYLRHAGREERVADVLRGEVLARCTGERGRLCLEAFLSRPERARAGAGSLSMFVNGRPVKDRALARAVAHAYGSVLEPGRYPVGVVYLDLPFESVDVNVHPQKSEVRFAEGRAVHDAVFRVLEGELGRAFSAILTKRTGEGRPYRPSSEALEPHQGEDAPRAIWTGSGAIDFAARAPDDRAVVPAVYPPADAARDGGVPELGALDGLRFLAQLRLTYLLCEGPDALVILDQHAAAERVTFHKLQRDRAARGVATQGLLVPAVVRLDAREVALLDEVHEPALRMGLDVRPIGGDAVAVHAVPALAGALGPEKLVRDLATELADAGGRGFSAVIDKVVATMACHASLRAGDRVSPEEARSLLAALAEVDFAGHCPHGRPIVTRVPFAELERRVGRR